MTRTVLVICMLTFVVGYTAFQAKLSADYAPPTASVQRYGRQAEASFESYAIDFGEVESTEAYIKTVSFRNLSEHTLVPSSVRASCGCVSPSLSANEFPPGSSGELKVFLNPARLGGAGPFNVTVTVAFEGVEQTAVLDVSGVLLPKKP